MLKRQIFSRNLYGKVFHFYKNYTVWASLVAQGLKKKKICLPMQKSQVQSLAWEDPTSCGACELPWATNPMDHNY